MAEIITKNTILQKRAPVGEEVMGRGNRRQMPKEEVIGALTMPVFWGVEVFLMARQHIIRWRFDNSLENELYHVITNCIFDMWPFSSQVYFNVIKCPNTPLIRHVKIGLGFLANAS